MTDEIEAGPLAQSIAREVLSRCGIREPQNHTKWLEITDAVQDEIDKEMDAMTRAASREAIPRPWHFVQYELASKWFSRGLLGQLSEAYSTWKARRKFAKYERDSIND